MQVEGLSRKRSRPLNLILQTAPYRFSVKEILDAKAMASNTVNPILCRVSLYPSPMFPRPTIRYFIKPEWFYKNDQFLFSCRCFRCSCCCGCCFCCCCFCQNLFISFLCNTRSSNCEYHRFFLIK